MRITVIDDQKNILSGIVKILQPHYPAFMVSVTQYPAQCIDWVKNKNYDLAITDLIMPAMDGLELSQKLLKINPSMKIIMMTGYATMKTALLAQRAGVCCYLAKPFTRQELLEAVRLALNPEMGLPVPKGLLTIA